LRRTCAKLCHDRGGEIEQIQFLLGHASVQTTERYLGCKQNLGHPVNDLFDLRLETDQQTNRDESVPTTEASETVAEASEQGIECRHGGSKDERPVCHSKQLSLPEQSHLVEVGKSHRAESLRCCSEAGTPARYGGSKTEGESNERACRRMGIRTLLDPAS
jgi:hypothetical protein